MKTLFVDVNVLLDVALERKPFAASAQQLLMAIESHDARGSISALTCSILYYLIQKETNHKIAVQYVRRLMQLFDVVALTRDVLTRALELDLKDFEDGVQAACAEVCHADHFITRNSRDFRGFSMSCLSPSEYLALSAG